MEGGPRRWPARGGLEDPREVTRDISELSGPISLDRPWLVEVERGKCKTLLTTGTYFGASYIYLC